MKSYDMRSRRRALGALATLASIGVLAGKTGGAVDAWVMSTCQVNTTQIYYLIESSLANTTFYLNRFLDGKNLWNSAGSDIQFLAANPTTTPVHFRVRYTSVAGTTTNTNTDYCPGGHFGPNSYMQFSSAFIPPQSDTNRNVLDAVHELGHVGGISHLTGTMICSDSFGPNNQRPKSVMKATGSASTSQWWAYLNCGGVMAPYLDDIAGVNYAHPGGK